MSGRACRGVKSPRAGACSPECLVNALASGATHLQVSPWGPASHHYQSKFHDVFRNDVIQADDKEISVEFAKV